MGSAGAPPALGGAVLTAAVRRPYHARMPRSLYLVDGHAQIFRAYYAPFGNLTSPTGEPTRATHVFFQMLLNLLRDRRPDYLAVALDVSDETSFRRQIDPQYKANRDAAPEDLHPQIERIIAVLDAVGVPMLRLPGFEADDILATLVQRLAGPDLDVFLVSRDKDLDQLLRPHVALYDPMKDELITHDRLLELKGWTPQQAVEAQILTGDSTDNVPGVPGIGPKTAAKLLQQYGSLAGIFAAADQLTPRQRENVKAFEPKAEIVRRLVTLRTDVPIELHLSAADCTRFAWAAAQPIFQTLGFRRLVEQLPGVPAGGATAADRPPGLPDRASADPEPQDGASRADRPAGRSAEPIQSPARAAEFFSGQGSLFGPAQSSVPAPAAAATSAPAATRANAAPLSESSAALLTEAERAALVQPDPGSFEAIETLERLRALADELSRQPAFCIDTETTGLAPMDADLVGIALAWQVGKGYYIPVRCATGPALPPAAVCEALAPLLADAGTLKVGHHLKYDLNVLRNAGMPVSGPLFDTMIAAFVLDPGLNSYKLDTLAQRFFGHVMIPITDLIGRGRDQLRMDQVPLPRVAEYAAEDADYTWRLKVLLEGRLRGAEVADLFYKTEMPLVRVLTDMEFEGISIDVDYLRQMSRTLAARAAELNEQVQAEAGVKFNLDSPKQLAEVLFDTLKFRVIKRTRTARSTDADTLEALARETGHPLLAKVLEYRELQKLLGTYVDALPKARSRRTGRVHTSFHQTGAITGRLSSSEPNLQNIPIRTEIGRQIRRAFVPRQADQRLIVADYSQVELRVLAHFCEDEALTRAFRDNLDIHAFVAAEINGVALDAVTREMRARAKAVNFGLIYGQTAFGLAQATGMSRTEATAFIERYFARYPRIRGFIDRCIQQARNDGYVATILGRRRPIHNIHSRNPSARAQAERLAVNTVVQGSAADLIKSAMNRLHSRVTEQRLPLRLLLQVHDELVCEAPQAQAQELAEVVAEVMRTALPLRVPLAVDVAVAANWLEAK